MAGKTGMTGKPRLFNQHCIKYDAAEQRNLPVWAVVLVSCRSMNALASNMTSALPTLLLWAGASLVAMVLLGQSMKRRREGLTEILKKHVSEQIGPPDEVAPPEPESKA